MLQSAWAASRSSRLRDSPTRHRSFDDDHHSAHARDSSMFDATFTRPTNAAGSEAGACTADDPVDGNPAAAADGVAGTHRAGDGRQPGARPGRGRRRTSRKPPAEDESRRAALADTERELVVKDDREQRGRLRAAAEHGRESAGRLRGA